MPIGIRDLRADLAAHVRRAAAGEPTVVSIGGRPAAVLVPLSAVTDATSDATRDAMGDATRDAMGDATSDAGPWRLQRSALIASGALVPPRRADGRVPDRHVTVWGNVRLDRLLREIRG